MTKQTLTKAAANQAAKVSSAFVFEGRIVKAGDKITLKHSDFKMLQHRGKVVGIKETTTNKKPDASKKPAAAKAENESKTPNENDDG